MKFVWCLLHNSTEAFYVWFKVVSNDFSEELICKKEPVALWLSNCKLFLAVSLKHTKTQLVHSFIFTELADD